MADAIQPGGGIRNLNFVDKVYPRVSGLTGRYKSMGSARDQIAGTSKRTARQAAGTALRQRTGVPQPALHRAVWSQRHCSDFHSAGKAGL